ncbi:hypothetical protein [Ferrimonas balearica]|uniref:hypothetical protein n=1 Tax=Ferrimonas balearica TaxID=44012 RepID=UPI001C99394C|nr:hypothetical protein [Ferrimonas balearica]MBY5991897.1 hypothetical protein [Ferrimonas balearica]
MSALSYTYLGTADDAVHRYPWEIEIDLEQLNRMLVRKVLLGERVLINDGYLLNLPAARKALMFPQLSPLRALIESNFVRILSRNQDLIALPEQMAQQGVASFQALVNSSQWPTLRDTLRPWQAGLQANGNFVNWPKKHISHGFDLMMQRTFEQSPGDLGLSEVSESTWQRTVEGYQERNLHDREATRTRWEQAATEAVKQSDQDSGALLQLMGLANSAYHYNFGVCLGDYDALQNARILVETKYSPAFATMTQLDAAPTLSHTSVPALTIPKNLPLDAAALWKVLADPFSDISTARQDYTLAMEGFMAGQVDKATLDAQATAYSRALSAHFGQAKEAKPLAQKVIGLGFLGVGSLGGPVTGALLWMAENLLLPTVMRRFHIKDKGFFDTQGDPVAALGDLSGKPLITSVALEGQLSRQLASQIPSFS